MKAGLLALPFVALGSLVVACVGDSPGPTATPDGGTQNDGGTLPDGATCDAPKKSCTKGSSTVCTDVSSDDQNCGDCNAACAAGATCKSSKCACTDATKTYCDKGGVGTCADLGADPNNCGACGNKCVNQHCTAGECDRVVFVTKVPFSTNLGGLSGADAICQSEAKDAGLSGTFQAWLSDGNVGPSTRFTTKSKTPYVLADGATVVAPSFAALSAGIQHVINLAPDATQVTAQYDIMSNTNTAGANDSVSFNCSGWTSSTSDGTAYQSYYQGDLTKTSTWSTQSSSFINCNPNLLQRFYCFQQ